MSAYKLQGVIATPVKNVLLVTSIVRRALDHLVMHDFQRKDASYNPWKRTPEQDYAFKECQLTLTPEQDEVKFTLRFHEKEFDVTVAFAADGANSAFAPESLSVEVQCYTPTDHLEPVLKTVLRALRILGPVYARFQYCGSDSISLWDIPTHTLAEAVLMSSMHFEQVEQFHKAGKLAAELALSPFELLGYPEHEWEELQKHPYSETRWGNFRPRVLELFPSATWSPYAAIGMPERIADKFAANR